MTKGKYCLSLIIFLIMFISSCASYKTIQYPCQIYYQNENCTCPQGLNKVRDYGGYICENESAKCLGVRLHTGECIDKCPEGYKPVLATETNEAPLCFPNYFGSEELLYNETKCTNDGDCVWDNFNSFQCCPCNTHIYNKESVEKYKKWREINCNEISDPSDFKWYACNRANTSYCRSNETSPLRCINGLCVTSLK